MSSAETFYPQHFRATRPYVKALVADMDAMLASRKLSPDSASTQSTRRILDAYHAAGVSPNAPDFNIRGFAVENQAALAYCEWSVGGAVIYDFKPQLTEALGATAVNEVSISDLHFPVNCMYVHFGPQKDMVLQSGGVVTGAFVLWAPGVALRFSLTAPLPSGTALTSRWAEVYDLRIAAKHFKSNLDEAIDRALEEDVEDLLKAGATMTRRGSPYVTGEAVIQSYLDAHKQNAATFARCCRLVASALCYVSAFPSDDLLDWQTGTPEKLRAKTLTGTAKETQRATSKLNAMGYRRVHHIGREFSDAAENAAGDQMTPHLRRAHWRRQAYGPQHSLRKIIRVQQVRVLGGGPVSDEPRVYSTERPTPPESKSS